MSYLDVNIGNFEGGALNFALVRIAAEMGPNSWFFVVLFFVLLCVFAFAKVKS